MFENPLKQLGTERAVSKNEKSNWHPRELAKALAVMAALGPVEGKAEAIESINGNNWSSGVELLKENIIGGAHEVGALFFINGAGEENWQSFGTPKGSDEVSINIWEGHDSLREYEETNGKAERACFAHTHPVGALFEDTKTANQQIAPLADQGKIFFAPSITDITVMSGNQLISQNFSSLVFEMSGAWYMRMANESDFENSPAIKEFSKRQALLKDNLFGTAGKDGALAEGLNKMSDEDIALILEGVEGSVKRWSELDERSDRELSIISITDQLLTKDSEGIDLESFVTKIGPDVTNTYSELKTLKDQSKFIYDFTQAYAMLSNLSPSSELKIIDSAQEQLESLRPTYIEQYRGEFGHEPELGGDLKELLLEGLLLNGAKGRFVSYDQLATEPPCAGPDYDSGNNN